MSRLLLIHNHNFVRSIIFFTLTGFSCGQVQTLVRSPQHCVLAEFLFFRVQTFVCLQLFLHLWHFTAFMSRYFQKTQFFILFQKLKVHGAEELFELNKFLV